jgi:hypothetical protein
MRRIDELGWDGMVCTVLLYGATVLRCDTRSGAGAGLFSDKMIKSIRRYSQTTSATVHHNDTASTTTQRPHIHILLSHFLSLLHIVSTPWRHRRWKSISPRALTRRVCA